MALRPMTEAELKELSRQLAHLSQPSVRDFYSEAHAACAIQNGRPPEPHHLMCQQHRMKRMHTRPYTPRTNGKAERFIQTALREWAYGCTYNTSEEIGTQRIAVQEPRDSFRIATRSNSFLARSVCAHQGVASRDPFTPSNRLKGTHRTLGTSAK